MTPLALGPFDFERVVNAAQKIEERLLRSTGALEAGGIPYAVIGGNAVANWVSRADESLVRFTRDVDLLLRREDLAAAERVLTRAGFLRRKVKGIEMFLDGPEAKAGDAVQILFAREQVRVSNTVPAPDVLESEQGERYRVLTLEALLRMKLNANRDKDRTHIRDLIGVSSSTRPGCRDCRRNCAHACNTFCKHLKVKPQARAELPLGAACRHNLSALTLGQARDSRGNLTPATLSRGI